MCSALMCTAHWILNLHFTKLSNARLYVHICVKHIHTSVRTLSTDSEMCYRLLLNLFNIIYCFTNNNDKHYRMEFFFYIESWLCYVAWISYYLRTFSPKRKWDFIKLVKWQICILLFSFLVRSIVSKWNSKNCK